MLVCLACPKPANISTPTHADDPHHHHHAGLGKSGAPSREHIKSFTNQLKDIVMKFSTGAYRHCRPCTAGVVRGGDADHEDKHTLYGEDDENSSILLDSNSEEQALNHIGLHDNFNAQEDAHSTPRKFGRSSTSSRYDLLPIGRNKRRHCRTTKKISSSSKSSLSLKQLPSHPDSYKAIEELLNAHFRREERILAEEQLSLGRDDRQQLESRADHQLLEESQLLNFSNRESQIEEHMDDDDDDDDDDDGHVKRSKRDVNVESAGNFEEWVAQVEPGVMITFVALPDGSNHLKRIRFSRELFSKWQAQLWWAENSGMVRELYSVSKTEAPFKSCSSARSSSSRTSTTTSSQHQHTLQNTPELQSRMGSCQTSPSNTPMIMNMLENKRRSSLTSSNADSFKGLSHELVDHRDNPLYDNPEFELCYNEGVKDTLVSPRDLWVSTLEEHSQQPQEDTHVHVDDDASSSAFELVRELKRVRFIK